MGHPRRQRRPRGAGGELTIRDAELVRRALAGSQDAYREIVRRFERPVLSLIVRMVRDPAVAEDLAQEAFVKAFRNLARYDTGRKLSSWLFKIAHNTTLDHLRRKSPETVPLEQGDAAGEETWEVLEAPAAGGPERRAESAELRAGLEAAMARLKPSYREILLLRFREGLAYQEIADVIDVPMGTVKIQLHRARKQLARQLEELGHATPARGRRGRTSPRAKQEARERRRASAREDES